MTSDRLEGAPNFRSVAALPAGDGRRLRTLRLFRSDALHRLTDADLPRLAALRIGAVLDLRRDDERTSAPSRWPAPAAPETLTFDVAPDLQAVRAGGWRDRLADPDFDAGQARRWMIDTYARMPGAFAPAVREAVGRLSVPSAATTGALLVHCTAGKDRTGVAAMLLLAALGVEEEVIHHDYLATNRLWRRDAEVSAGLPPVVADTLLSVQPAFLEAAYEAIHSGWGSIDAYLHQQLGLDDARMAVLRARLVE